MVVDRLIRWYFFDKGKTHERIFSTFNCQVMSVCVCVCLIRKRMIYIDTLVSRLMARNTLSPPPKLYHHHHHHLFRKIFRKQENDVKIIIIIIISIDWRICIAINGHGFVNSIFNEMEWNGWYSVDWLCRSKINLSLNHLTDN